MNGGALPASGSGEVREGGRRRSLSRALKVLVSVGIVCILFRRVPAGEVMGALRLAKGAPIILACAVSLFTQVFLAWRLRMLTTKQGIRLGFGRILEVNLSSMFYVLFVPGGTVGSLMVRVYKLTRAEKKLPEAVAAVVFDRVAATAALCLVGGGFWLIDRPSTGAAVRLAMTGVLAVTAILIALLLSRRTANLLLALARRVPFAPVASRMEKQIRAVERFHDMGPPVLALVLGISVLTQLLGLLTFGILGQSLGLTVSWTTLGWIRGAAIVVAMLPVGVAGIGVREGTILFLLQDQGVSPESALAVSILVTFATVLLVSFVGGLVEGARFFFGEQKKRPRNKSEAAE
ncbi:MAG: lysylphosphatidylglycerol synthase transmembrane domain-containing protein [Candidatus Eisenbacteria bacterium]